VLPDQVCNEIRAKRYSICTEQEQKELKKKLSLFAIKRIKEKREFFNIILITRRAEFHGLARG